MELATPASKADTARKPAAATHVLMFWPPTWRGLLDRQIKRITRAGEWVYYTVTEFEEGDYCAGDERRLGAGQRTPVEDLAAWTSGKLGQSVKLQFAGETEYGPVYWVAPDGSR